MATILCLVYQRTEDEALRDFLWRHRRLEGLNESSPLPCQPEACKNRKIVGSID
jgi:hypothetical protein